MQMACSNAQLRSWYNALSYYSNYELEPRINKYQTEKARNTQYWTRTPLQVRSQLQSRLESSEVGIASHNLGFNSHFL